jgi:thiol-disulfide isomerase/thioredoxin
MRRTRTALLPLAFGIVLLAGTRAATGQTDARSLAGRWDATVTVNGVEVPFAFEIASTSDGPRGTFFNGTRRIASTRGSLENQALVFEYGQYAATLKASVVDGTLTGDYVRGTRTPYPFKAVRAAKTAKRETAAAPSIAGTWILAAAGNKGEAAWRFVVDQKGADVSATILRVDGDTGTLNGSFKDGVFVLSHFSGARPLLLEVTPRDDGSLALRQNRKTEFVAVREGTARAAEIGAPTDSSLHTSVSRPSERFKFSGTTLDGRPVDERDPRFAGKVLLVNVSGSWCPNCHDEAPFLTALDRQYRARGLEIVTLSFEEEEQLANPARLRAFIAQYGFAHTVLLAGEPDDTATVLPQAVNLNAFPTTFIVGRDGRARAVHAGFPSPGSGKFYEKAEREMRQEIERLLGEKAITTEEALVRR